MTSRKKEVYGWKIIGCEIWYFLHHSGIHSTIAGVLLAVVMPIEYKNIKPLEKLSEWLHKPVNYFVIPLFALENTAIMLNVDVWSAITSTIIVQPLWVGTARRKKQKRGE